jgi:hypothetical protein
LAARDEAIRQIAALHNLAAAIVQEGPPIIVPVVPGRGYPTPPNEVEDDPFETDGLHDDDFSLDLN